MATLIERIGHEKQGQIFQGDCLQACSFLRTHHQKVDLVYIDPPFSSSCEYKRPIYTRPLPGQTLDRSTKLTPCFKQTVFEDTKKTQDFLNWLKLDLMAIHAILSDNGSIFLHLDHHISHYAKILLDEIFGIDNFRNEIIWSYKTGGVSKRTFAKKHDTIFFYSKSNKYTFHPQYYRSYQAKRYNYNPKYPEIWDEETQRWYHISVCRDVWDDINVIGTEREGSERLDYPTQKPEALLERIINAASSPNMLVADFFGGSGVCASVAHRLGRRFFHSDISSISIATTRDRLRSLKGEFEIYSSNFSEDNASDQLPYLTIKEEPAPIIQCKLIKPRPKNSNNSLQMELEGLEDCQEMRPNYCLQINKYHSAILDNLCSRAKKTKKHRSNKANDTEKSSLANGLQYLEWLSIDCQSSKGAWHSDIEIYIDPYGCAWKDGQKINWEGNIVSEARPLRLRVRDIYGQESVATISK